MGELTNLTDRISHLRDRKQPSPLMQGGKQPMPDDNLPVRRSLERRFATDYFMIFTYALLAVALIAQLLLIVWLDFA